MMSKKKETKEELFCLCRKAFDEGDEDQMMIECDSCKDWLHGKCVNISVREAADIEIYMCPRCINGQKQIIYKKILNRHRHDFSDPEGHKKPMQAGTQVFVEKLLERSFPCAVEHGLVKVLEGGRELTIDYFDKHGFSQPILIKNKEELQFSMPGCDDIDLTKIEDIVGSEYEIDVIDVERQESFPMKISELNDYFKTTPRSKTYNLISFEISKTNLTLNVTAPKVVCDMSWASNNVWPQPLESDGYSDNQKLTKVSKTHLVKPEVQKYCLISAAKSYTDFHIDFGGSSVWYHAVKGDKIFYLIEPTDENVKAYEKWLCVKNHSEMFLGDKVKACYKFEIKQGNTLFLPTAWIHAVYTPNDSLVFGGNFLHSYNIPLQLKIYDMELRLQTPDKFRFPSFETFQWYALKHHENQVKKANLNRECIGHKAYNDLKYLRDHLKKWISSKNFYELHDYYIPRSLDYDKLINIMNRELAKQEVLLKSNTSNNKAENSLKIKLKLNPNDLASSTSTLICEKPVSLNAKPKVKKEKEVLSFKPSANVTEIKFDDYPTEQDKPPIKLVMKIPKIFSESEAGLVKIENEPIKPIKLKIKTQDMVTVVATSQFKESPKYEEKSESDAEIRNEDDEFMHELKNSYQDNEFFYPSLKICGTTARTSKKAKQLDSTPTDKIEAAVAGEEKKSRKRKLKPQAAQYLESKQEKIDQDAKTSEIAEADKASDAQENKINSKAAMPDIDTNNSQDSKTIDSDDDQEFRVEDEEDLDYDKEFKIKCEQNLKLSKKLKTKSVKHHKKLESQGTSEEAIANRTVDPTSKFNNKSSSNKNTKKKGYATTKQRLGKLLKLNRLVNI